jgi:hypothetical protein
MTFPVMRMPVRFAWAMPPSVTARTMSSAQSSTRFFCTPGASNVEASSASVSASRPQSPQRRIGFRDHRGAAASEGP